MKRFLIPLLAVLTVTACSTARRASTALTPATSWIGCTTTEILDAMGDPARIDGDGQDGSILVYESAPDYSSPDYDILAPEASVSPRRYANFYLDEEGRCYRVDTNRNLPAPRYLPSVSAEFWLDVLYYLPLLTLLVLL
jgi:hypothetical protein